MKILDTIAIVIDLLTAAIIACVLAAPAFSAPPKSTVPTGPVVRSSGNFSTKTRYTDSSGKSLGYKRTYDHGEGGSVRSTYYDRNGRQIGQEVGRNSTTTNRNSNSSKSTGKK